MKNPINYSLKTEIFPFLIMIAAVVISFWAYPKLPDLVISHWDFSGNANGWLSREVHSILFPAILVGIYLIFSIIPKFDPQGERYVEFAGVYRIMRNSILLILLIIFLAATLSNLGYKINIGGIVAGAIGILMIIMGNYFGKLKRNYFIGIRTPWTLSSENVWNKNHRLGGRLFIIWGVALIAAPWLRASIAFGILFGGIIIILSWVMIYSYSVYRKEQNK